MTSQIVLYLAGSALFVMWIHFAIHIKREFSVWVMIGIFVLGGIIGYLMESMVVGFLFAMIVTFLFW